jgi:hypothetical protein
MTPLRKMLDEGASPVERWLLESAEEDAPPADGPRGIVRTLGVDASLDAPDALDAAPSNELGAIAHGVLPDRSATRKALLVTGAQWLGAGLVAGAIVTGALRWVSPPEVPRLAGTLTSARAQSFETRGKPSSQTGAPSADEAVERVSAPASPSPRSDSEPSGVDEPGRAAKARPSPALPRRSVAAPNAWRRPAPPRRSERALVRAQASPSAPAASSVAAFPDG